ncbi:MAG TPA: hypothetical protein VLS27_16215, partial [Gammaproteobacteria bacterium]|nr:hypothetical protein [Gammaproteobacteria bacterium]
MKMSKPTESRTTEAQEIARQADVELAILLGIEQSLRIALQWMTRDRGNSHKLATLRFTARSFERHLTRTRVLADHGGYMHSITDANPHLASKVRALKDVRGKLQANFERIILRLEYVSPDDAAAFGEVCAELECYLEQLRTHGEK